LGLLEPYSYVSRVCDLLVLEMSHFDKLVKGLGWKSVLTLWTEAIGSTGAMMLGQIEILGEQSQ
jgi:hypothetical protein